ncbi:MAG TPA: zf-TFIIB domain-containing protein [Gemmatimonadales bacterium]|nr:zf-TFIIB domain-containing protein [Gemmatimonadales bacterium]
MTSHLATNAFACPYCLAIMQTMHQGKVQLEVCIACGTRWFDRADLAAVVDQVASDAVLGWDVQEVRGDVNQNCPRCRTQTLEPWTFGQVGFRRCGTCGGVSIPSEDLDVIIKAVGGPGSRLAEIVKELFGARRPA